MENVKRVKKSGMVNKLGKALWAHYERQCGDEHQGEPSIQQNTPASVTQPPSYVEEYLEDMPDEGEMFLEEELLSNVDDVDEDVDFLDLPQMNDDEQHEDENEFIEDESNLFVRKLRIWALSHRVTHVALKELLLILSDIDGLHIPQDPRTLLKTPKAVGKEITTVSGGEMWYQGIEKSLKHHFRSITPSVDVFVINLFVDGLPLHNSSPTEFWPIMMQLYEQPEVPILTLGIYCGSSKPHNVEDYLRPLVVDLNHAIEEGIVINRKKINICLRAFIADTPARTFIKGVAAHNGYQGCTKCKIAGRYCKAGRKIIFEGVAAERTDAEFRGGNYIIGHQKKLTPLLDVKGLDVVKQILVADELHIIHLGIIRKLLKGYTVGALSPFEKWNHEEISEFSKTLVSIELPAEIHRVVRPLQHVAYWKGTEYRTFLNHIGIPFLKGRISDAAYHHFKLFYVAITLFSSQHFASYWKHAGKLLEKFVVDYSDVYDRKYLTSNVHNLLHIEADVTMFGALPTISSYPFENRLQFIKKLIRTGHRTLSQVICRLTELNQVENEMSKDRSEYPHLKYKKNEVILQVKPNFVLRTGNRNGFF
ncbi:uncharacterized protein LOC125761706 [Anopheles funestus]|uniref:uncharacterized protein LOC125761706 n=1 Tax=Anopheles funestus TaxID=62324 RepID=UPI0020C6B0C0|nr:uncharacterized protein LOC125761706 [Anopheles funestus]